MASGDALARTLAAVGAAAAALLAAMSLRAAQGRRRGGPGRGVSGVPRRRWREWWREAIPPEPVALAGAPLGPCLQCWTPEYLEARAGDRKVSVHVSRDRGLDFASKNFGYEVMPLRSFLSRACRESTTEYFYYRSQHAKRNKPSNLESLAPLDEDFQLPEALAGSFEVHSTVLRIASAGLRMWLHYDICDNLLCCIRGRKRVLLIPPSEVGRCYMSGSSSALGSRLLEEDPARRTELWSSFPLARTAWERRSEVVLEEGDTLFIPSLWLHSTEAVCEAGASGICISLNVFFIRPELAAVHDPKDVWANRDLIPAQEAFRALDERVWPALKRVPQRHRAFYCRRVAAEMMAMAEEAGQ